MHFAGVLWDCCSRHDVQQLRFSSKQSATILTRLEQQLYSSDQRLKIALQSNHYSGYDGMTRYDGFGAPSLHSGSIIKIRCTGCHKETLQRNNLA